MTTNELAAATAEFDREFIAESSRPMSATERAQWNAAKRKRGRPKVGAGSKVVSVSIERDLLKQVDALAKKAGLSRARLIAAGLHRLLVDARPAKSAAKRSRAA